MLYNATSDDWNIVLLLRRISTVRHSFHMATSTIMSSTGVKRKRKEIVQTSKKRRSPRFTTTSDVRECSICTDHVEHDLFPAIIHTGAAEHKSDICFSCWDQHVISNIDDTPYDRLHCPECAVMLQEPDIKRLASNATHTRCEHPSFVKFPC